MAQHIDLNKPPQGLGSSITPDWTSLNNQSDPYYLKAEEKTVNGETDRDWETTVDIFFSRLF